MALPSELLRALGGFDTTFTLAAAEDVELCDRWLHQGYEMVYAPEVRVYHAHQLTLFSFCRQHFNYGRGRFCFYLRRSSRTNKRIQVDLFKFIVSLLTYPFLQNSEQPAILVTGLSIVSLVADTAGLYWESLKVKLLSGKLISFLRVAKI